MAWASWARWPIAGQVPDIESKILKPARDGTARIQEVPPDPTPPMYAKMFRL